MAAEAAIDFWFDPASTYSYLAAMRIKDLAAARGVRVSWRPFLLGPIFKSQGWDTSPFDLFPMKGRYMWRDLERLTADYGLPLVRPDPFPFSSVLAARVCLATPPADRPPVARAIYRAAFGEGRDVATAQGLSPVLADLGLDPEETIARATTEENKLALREETAAAQAAGVFGAPTFVTADGDVFWGDDRLERALAAARALADASAG